VIVNTFCHVCLTHRFLRSPFTIFITHVYVCARACARDNDFLYFISARTKGIYSFSQYQKRRKRERYPADISDYIVLAKHIDTHVKRLRLNNLKSDNVVGLDPTIPCHAFVYHRYREIHVTHVNFSSGARKIP